MIYMTKITLDMKKPDTRKGLANPHIFHAVIENACGRTDSRKLWRLEQGEYGGHILLLSDTVPDKELVSKIAAEDAIQTAEYRILDRIECGETYRFRLTAAPMVSKLYRKDEKRGFKRLCSTQEEQCEWIEKRQDSMGVRLLSYTVSKAKRTMVSKELSDGRINKDTYIAVQYDGAFRVTDAEVLKKVLIDGVGHKKAFGEGMLTIARL